LEGYGIPGIRCQGYAGVGVAGRELEAAEQELNAPVELAEV
jgi:hypothetical protein